MPDQAQPVLEQVGVQTLEQISETVAPVDSSLADASPSETSPSETWPGDAPPIAPAASAELVPTLSPEPAPVSLQTITNAYSNYTLKSLEQTQSFVAQLAGVRSLNKAFELQAEYAKQAFETFMAESRRIGELHSELNRQRMRSFEGLLARMRVTRSS